MVTAFDAQERQEWPTTKKLDDFLGESGYTIKDLEYIERLDLLEQRHRFAILRVVWRIVHNARRQRLEIAQRWRSLISSSR